MLGGTISFNNRVIDSELIEATCTIQLPVNFSPIVHDLSIQEQMYLLTIAVKGIGGVPDLTQLR